MVIFLELFAGMEAEPPDKETEPPITPLSIVAEDITTLHADELALLTETDTEDNDTSPHAEISTLADARSMLI